MSNDKKFIVGAISSHGHERGHVLVLDQLPEVEAIHVCAATELADVEEMVAESPKVVSKTRDVAGAAGQAGPRRRDRVRPSRPCACPSGAGGEGRAACAL